MRARKYGHTHCVSALWRKYAYVAKLNDQTPSHTLEEYLDDPGRRSCAGRALHYCYLIVRPRDYLPDLRARPVHYNRIRGPGVSRVRVVIGPPVAG